MDPRHDDFLERLEKVSARLRTSNSDDLSAVFRQLHQEDRNLDPRVFTECADGPELTDEEFHTLQWEVRNTLREHLSMQPLAPPENLNTRRMTGTPLEYHPAF